MEVDKIMRTLLTLGVNSSTPRRHGSGQNNENITNTRGKLTRALHEDMEVDKIMSTLLTLEENSSTPRRHGSGQNNENITNTRGKLEHSTKTWKWTN
jgi:hypothetical protein